MYECVYIYRFCGCLRFLKGRDLRMQDRDKGFCFPRNAQLFCGNILINTQR